MLRKQKFRIGILMVGSAVLFSFQNCAYSPNTGAIFNGGAGANAELSQAQALEKSAVSILGANCAGCHNSTDALAGFTGVADIDYLKYYRYVLPGEPAISPLYDAVSSGLCPPSRPLSQKQIKTLYDWINEGLTHQMPSGPPPDAGPLEAKWASISRKILGPRCIQCHRDGAAQKNYSFSSFESARASGAFVPGSSATSPMYINTANGNMPRSGGLLSPAELNAIRGWIDSGAPNN